MKTLTPQQKYTEMLRIYDRMAAFSPVSKKGWLYFFIWPIFNRSRLIRFNNLWESGLFFNDCWRMSK